MDNLNWIKVKSSNLARVAYDKKDKELYVEFKSGNKYSYINVSYKKYENLVYAESVGSYFSTKIKPNHDFRDWN
jgi:hypothetical protein